MVSNRKNQVNTWVDKEFKRFLEEMKAKKIIAGEPIDNLGQITEQMMKTQAMKDLEQQLMNNKENLELIKIKMDKRRGGIF